MRILALVTDAFGGHGGIAQFNRDFLAGLCLHPGVSDVVAIPRLMPEDEGRLPEKLVYLTKGIGGKTSYTCAVLKLLLGRGRFDLIVCGHINLLPLAALCQTILKAPVLLNVYGIDAWNPTGSRIRDLLARRVYGFISISEVTAKRFRGWTGLGERKGFLLPCCVDLQRFGAGPKNADLLRRYGLVGKTVLMTMGRLASEEKYKGFDEVMELLPALSRDVPNVSYLIVGSGPDRARLERKAVALGVGDRVVFAGFVPEEEKADHFRLADAYVMPGRGEGFGIVYLEALACGVPVIGSVLDGSVDALRNGDLGQLVDPRDREAVKRAILQALAVSKRAVAGGLSYFSRENFVKRLHGHLDTFLAGPNP